MLTIGLCFPIDMLQLCAIRRLNTMNIRQHQGQSNSEIFNSGSEKRQRSAWDADDVFLRSEEQYLKLQLALCL